MCQMSNTITSSVASAKTVSHSLQVFNDKGHSNRKINYKKKTDWVFLAKVLPFFLSSFWLDNDLNSDEMSKLCAFLFYGILSVKRLYLWNGRKPDKFELHNSLNLSFAICEFLVLLLLALNFSLNQNPMIFFLCMSQTWNNQVNILCFLWVITFL